MHKDSRGFLFFLDRERKDLGLPPNRLQRKEKKRRRAATANISSDGNQTIEEFLFIEFCNPDFMVLPSIENPDEFFIFYDPCREYNSEWLPGLMSGTLIEMI